MSIAIIQIEKNKLSSLKKFIRQIRGILQVVKDKDLEELLEDRWLSKMIDQAEQEKEEVPRKEIAKKFEKDGIAF